MAKSLSYQEALTKGLVYPGAEQEALKITAGGKGFADTEAFKKAFDTSYQTKKSEVDVLTQEINRINTINTKANQLYNTYVTSRKKAVWGNYLKYLDYVQNDGAEFYNKTSSGYIREYRADQARNLMVEQINKLSEQQKGLSGIMEQAMAKYKATSEKAVEAEKRETGEVSAARRRLTRATGGLLAKAGAGGMVGTGLPDLGTGMGGGLGIDDQLGRKVKL